MWVKYSIRKPTVSFNRNIRHKLMQVALAMFTAGIIGNLYDRVFNNGGVRDFLDFYILENRWFNEYHWPAFNIADSMLCVAVGLLIKPLAHWLDKQDGMSRKVFCDLLMGVGKEPIDIGGTENDSD